MKADFEKGTKVCSRCRKELPLNMFSKDKGRSDGLDYYCKKCKSIMMRALGDELRKNQKVYKDKNFNTFGKIGHKRGNSGLLKRDYELSKEQLDRRNSRRRYLGHVVKHVKYGKYGILIWYSGNLDGLSTYEYSKIMHREYNRQSRCAIRGYVGRASPYEHFLFDFDLEQMLKDNVYDTGGGKKYYITKWWKGEIRHWTVKDGIWKE